MNVQDFEKALRCKIKNLAHKGVYWDTQMIPRQEMVDYNQRTINWNTLNQCGKVYLYASKFLSFHMNLVKFKAKSLNSNENRKQFEYISGTN